MNETLYYQEGCKDFWAHAVRGSADIESLVIIWPLFFLGEGLTSQKTVSK